jgi:hypothetical protein
VPTGGATIANLGLSSTAIIGVVTGLVGTTTPPVPLALIRFQHTDESTYSDSNGNYLLNAVEAGPRTLVIFSGAYPLKTVTTTLLQGAASTVNVVLGT